MELEIKKNQLNVALQMVWEGKQFLICNSKEEKKTNTNLLDAIYVLSPVSS